MSTYPSKLPPIRPIRDGITVGIVTLALEWLVVAPVLFPASPKLVVIAFALVLAPGIAISLGALTTYGGWRRKIDRDRRTRGLCLGCGYDLRASTDRCPECGRPIRRAIQQAQASRTVESTSSSPPS